MDAEGKKRRDAQKEKEGRFGWGCYPTFPIPLPMGLISDSQTPMASASEVIA